MKINVKDAIADIIKLEGVETVFGYTGGHIMHMWVAANNAGLKLILNKQEGNAVYMADSYTRVSGKPTVVFGTSGPGVQNMITGLSSAYADSIPLVVVGASVGTHAAGRNALQESSGRGRAVEQRLIFKACCKQAMTAPGPEAVPDMMRDAFRTAYSGRPGPVFVEVPSNFWGVDIDYKKVNPEAYKNLRMPGCDKKDAEKIAEVLYKADHPMILVGEGFGWGQDGNKLKNFLNKLRIPFAASSVAKNFVDEQHPLYMGGLRYHGGMPRTYEYMQKSDLILFLGAKMSQWEHDWDYDRETVGTADLAQVDPDENEIGRVYPVKYSAVGSIISFIDQVKHREHKNSVKMAKEVASLNAKIPLKKRNPDSSKGINPLNLIRIAEEYAADDAVFVFDTGYTGSLGIQKLRTKKNQLFIHSEKNSPMGYSVPAAIGANIAGRKEVICFVGDGSVQMSLNEFGTILNYGVRVIYVILNNGGNASIADFQGRVLGNTCATMFENPDYVKIAGGYGIKGDRADNTTDFEKVFKKALKEKGSTVVDAKVDQSIMEWR